MSKANRKNSPRQILENLKAGNLRFPRGHRENYVSVARRRSIAERQGPIATILTCSDSRVPPEHIFDQGLGDLFLVRTAGSIIGGIELGSLEHGCKHLQTGLLLVLGHSRCGAVTAAVRGKGKSGFIQAVVDSIAPIVNKISVQKEILH